MQLKKDLQNKLKNETTFIGINSAEIKDHESKNDF